MPHLLKIYNPIRVENGKAYFSLSSYNFRRCNNGTGKIKVRVYNGKEIAGEGIIDIKSWIKNCVEKQKKIMYRANEPMIYYFNFLQFQNPDEIAKQEWLEFND